VDGGPRCHRHRGLARQQEVARAGRPAHRPHDVRAVLLLHVPLEPPALPLALRHGLAHRARVSRAHPGRPRREPPPALAHRDAHPLRPLHRHAREQGRRHDGRRRVVSPGSRSPSVTGRARACHPAHASA
jgi:hypothetical protein